jgi:hypothetical protein
MPLRGPGTVEINEGRPRSVTTLLTLVILGVLWAAVLLPGYLRNRTSRQSDSVVSFRRLLHTLERAGPETGPQFRGALPPRVRGVSPIPVHGASSAMMPVGRSEVRRRRRDILFTLVGAAAITLVLTVLLGGVALWFHVLADVLVVTYVALLVQLRRTEADRSAKVRYLPAARPAPEPAALLVRRRA